MHKQPYSVAVIHIDGHRRYRHILTALGTICCLILSMIFSALIAKGAMIQAVILVVSYWFWRRVYVGVLRPKMECEADLCAFRACVDLKQYREELQCLADSRAARSCRRWSCTEPDMDNRYELLKKVLRKKSGSADLRRSIQRCTVGAWLGCLVLMSLILIVGSERIKAIALRYDQLSMASYEGGARKGGTSGVTTVAGRPQDDINHLYNLALGCIARKETERAIGILEKVIVADQLHLEARYNLAKLYGASGHVDREIEQYVKIISADHELPEVYYYLGRAYIRQGRSEEAISALLACVKLCSPNEPLGIQAAELINDINQQTASTAPSSAPVGVR
jgi:tetratricopeptide (TPR) repeat protein